MFILHTSVHAVLMQVTIFSAFVLGGLVYAFGQANWLNVPWSAPAALLFGVITSAVDPVAVSQRISMQLMLSVFQH